MTPVLEIVGNCTKSLWGLSPRERLTRAFDRAGAKAGGRHEAGKQILVVGAEWVLHPSLIETLVRSPGLALVDGDDKRRLVAVHIGGAPDEHVRAQARSLVETGNADARTLATLSLRIRTPMELGSSFNSALRKRGDVPFAVSLERMPLDEIERLTFNQCYKGVTDFVTKWLWPFPARFATRWAAEHRIHPNAVTTLSLVAVIAATYFFYHGAFALGLVAAWIMAFLDTVDGKLARVTMTYSWWGNIYDHGIDQIHPPIWWWAWWVGVVANGYDAYAPLLEPAMYVIVIGYVIYRAIEGLFLGSFRFQIHTWRSIDSVFRLVSARRNPNVVLLSAGAAIGRPDIGLLLVAGWTIVSLVFHSIRLLHAWALRVRGQTVSSWLAEAPA